VGVYIYLDLIVHRYVQAALVYMSVQRCIFIFSSSRLAFMSAVRERLSLENHAELLTITQRSLAIAL